MKIDAHQHFWKYSAEVYPWIDNKMKILKNDYLPSDLQPELKSMGFDGCIAVQARHSYDENIFLTDLASRYPFVKGVIGWIDLQADDVEEKLDELIKLPRICGVRHIVQDEPDENFLLRPGFLRGISLLNKYNMTYDILIYTNQLKMTSKFAAKFPGQRFVLDHIAKPNIKKGKPLKEWVNGINELAQFPNLYCKLSGMVTETDWHGWKPSDFVPYMDVIFEAFGTNRVMFGSDWPVCRLAAQYYEVVDIVGKYIESFSEQDKQDIMGGNASRFYNLTRKKHHIS